MATIFFATLEQMFFLMSFIIIGFSLTRTKILDRYAAVMLSRLGNYVFIPAFYARTFMQQFTIQTLKDSWKILLISCATMLVSVPIAVIFGRITKDSFLRKIYTYGLTFPNFGFIGAVLIAAIFPEHLPSVTIFTLPYNVLLEFWGIPYLLIPDEDDSHSFMKSLKKLVNPMMIGMVAGILISLLNIPLPTWTTSLVDMAANCMSPMIMILTGVVVARIHWKNTLTKPSIYVICALRLLLIPALTLAVCYFAKFQPVVSISLMAFFAMPLGLNPVVIPIGYGKDTSVAAGLILLSILFSAITVPLMFMLLQMII